jgi:hypothetical protein
LNKKMDTLGNPPGQINTVLMLDMQFPQL